MEISTTTGKDYVPDAPSCAVCNLDTAGTHETCCPLYELQRLARAKASESNWEGLIAYYRDRPHHKTANAPGAPDAPGDIALSKCIEELNHG